MNAQKVSHSYLFVKIALFHIKSLLQFLAHIKISFSLTRISEGIFKSTYTLSLKVSFSFCIFEDLNTRVQKFFTFSGLYVSHINHFQIFHNFCISHSTGIIPTSVRWYPGLMCFSFFTIRITFFLGGLRQIAREFLLRYQVLAGFSHISLRVSGYEM